MQKIHLTRNNKIRVLHAIKATAVCGAEKHLLKLLPGLNNGSYDITCLVLTEPDNPVDNYFLMLDELGIKTERIIIRNNIDPICFFKIYQLIKRNKYNIVHTHLIHADSYVALAAKLSGTSFIISTRHNDDKFRYNWFINNFVHQLSRTNNKIIAISNWLQKFSQDIEKIEPHKIVTIHYGLNNRELKDNDSDILKELNIPKDNKILCSVGRIVNQKGHKYLIDAMEIIVRERKDIRLIIVGDGVLKDRLVSYTKKLNLEKYIVFTGYRSDVPRILSITDVFVLPSLWEGFGLVLLEAMEFSKPVVASSVSAIPEIVEHNKTGLLVQPKHSNAIADAVLKILNNPELGKKMGVAGNIRLQRYFSVEKMVQKTEKVYKELIN